MFNTTIVDIRNFFAPENQYYGINKEAITDILLKRGVNNTFFIYSSKDFDYFWSIFTNSSLQFVTTTTTTTITTPPTTTTSTTTTTTTTTLTTTTTTTSTTSTPTTTAVTTAKSVTIDPVYTNDEFLLNPKEEICNPASNKSVLLITMVAIGPNSFEKRAMIRKTWANKTIFDQDMKLIFLLAKSANETVNKQIFDEHNQYKDVLLKNYTDSYHNLTAKIMFGLNWVSKYCPNSKYVLRINDDVIVNTYALISYLKSIEYKPNLIYGYTIAGVGPIRDPNSKFYVSKKEYPKNYYETYIEGSAYLYTTDLAPVYHKKYLNYYFPPFSIWLEDVYIGYVIFSHFDLKFLLLIHLIPPTKCCISFFISKRILAKMFNTSIVNIADKYFPWNQYLNMNKEDKIKGLLEKGLNKTIFVYDLDNFELFWSLFSNRTLQVF